MTQEEKDLLLQDLCTRLPYGVKVHINSCIDEQNQMELFDVNFASETIGVGNEKWAFRAIPIVDIDDNTKIVRPYLRPMSSMTEEERIEFSELFYKWHDDELFDYIEEGIEFSIWKHKGISPVVFDWLNQKIFDYRSLIPMGLAIEASKDMYSINK